jgi:hypothetical protein
MPPETAEEAASSAVSAWSCLPVGLSRTDGHGGFSSIVVMSRLERRTGPRGRGVAPGSRQPLRGFRERIFFAEPPGSPSRPRRPSSAGPGAGGYGRPRRRCWPGRWPGRRRRAPRPAGPAAQQPALQAEEVEIARQAVGQGLDHVQGRLGPRPPSTPPRRGSASPPARAAAAPGRRTAGRSAPSPCPPAARAGVLGGDGGLDQIGAGPAMAHGLVDQGQALGDHPRFHRPRSWSSSSTTAPRRRTGPGRGRAAAAAAPSGP